MALLKESGKIASESDELIRVVIGISRESMADFKSLVGMRSRSHVEFDAENIAFLTSSVLAGINISREGGGVGRGGLRSRKDVKVSGVNLAQRLVILLSKNCRKAEASVGAEMEFGSVGGGLRQRRPSRADQSLRGCWLWVVMRSLK
jgi:hypothetical protein